MKIDSTFIPQNPQFTKVSRRAPADLTETKPEQTQTSENAAAAPKTESPFDAAKVEEIKAAIAQGRFKINPEAIADGLIAMARDLIAETSA